MCLKSYLKRNQSIFKKIVPIAPYGLNSPRIIPKFLNNELRRTQKKIIIFCARVYI